MSEVTTATRAQRRGIPRSWQVLLEGTIGSLAILFGSFGVGWLAPGSPLNRMPFLIALRTEEVPVVLCTIVLTLGCWLLFRAWLQLGKVLRTSARKLRVLVAAMTLWSLPQMFCLPIFSRDVFAYIGQGRLVLAGQDPYEQTISVMNGWFQLGTDVTWADTQTAYGPLFYWLEAGVVWATGTNTELAIFLFRVVSLAGVALCFHYVRRLAQLHSVDPDRAAWLAVANPLFLISFVASGHNDSLMVGLALAAVYYAAKHRGLLAIVLITASISVKPITIVLLPFIGLLLAGKGASWPRKGLFWLYVGGLTLGLITVMGQLGGFGFGWVKAMLGAGTGATIFAPMGAANALFSGILAPFGVPSDAILPVLKLIGRAAGIAVVLVVIFRGRYENLVQRLTIAFAAIVVLSPVIQPWYLLWLLPFFAATGIRDDWQTQWVYLTVVFFVAWGAIDQLYVWQFLGNLEPLLRQLVTWLSVACVAFMVFVDPGTRDLFKDAINGNAWRRWRGRRAQQKQQVTS